MCAVVRYYNRVYVACLRCFGSRWGVPQCFLNLQNLKPTNILKPADESSSQLWRLCGREGWRRGGFGLFRAVVLRRVSGGMGAAGSTAAAADPVAIAKALSDGDARNPLNCTKLELTVSLCADQHGFLLLLIVLPGSCCAQLASHTS